MEPTFVDPKHSEITKSHRHLPHWTANRATYFVTFRTADSLPTSVQIRLQADRKKLNLLSGEQLLTEKRRLSKLLNDELDKGLGKCPFRNLELAQIVARELRALEHEHLELFAWCIMPNHVHVILGMKSDIKLSQIMQFWKGRSARAINILQGSSGKVWQDESFDHLVRSGEKLLKFARYIQMNPSKAGLSNWEWLYVRDDVKCLL